MSRTTVIVVGLAVAALLSGGRLAHAEEPDGQVQRLNKKAMQEYDLLEFEKARRNLLEALTLLKRAGRDETPLAAKTHGNLAVVYINGFKDRERGVAQLTEALRLLPDYQYDPAVGTPELAEAFAAAKPKAPVATSPPSPSAALAHERIGDARAQSSITVRAAPQGGLVADRVFVLFRGVGHDEYTALPMTHRGGEWSGTIPADAVVVPSLQYYLEARDAGGRALITVGSALDPIVIAVHDTSLPPSHGGAADREDPLAKERQRARATEEGRGYRRLFLFVMPGFGFGVEGQGNHTEVAWQYQSTSPTRYVQQPVGKTGVALAPLHLGVEVGLRLTQRFSLSLLGRFQLVTGANAETVDAAQVAGTPTYKSSGAAAGFLRARYQFMTGALHPYLHADIGGGEVRHMLDISSAESDTVALVDAYAAAQYNSGQMVMMTGYHEVCANHKKCIDTIALGYLFLGGGAGFLYDFTSRFSLILDFNIFGAIGGTHDRQSGMNADIQLGVGAHFL